jgi:hypothetical protein
MVPGYVQPSGIIKLYRGVPLSPDHADVLYITSEEQALNYLYNYSAREFTQESYTRGETGVLKIKETADALMLYNYLSWSNNWPNGQKKYFFAFITSVNYINNNCTAIEFVVDNYMTWFPHLQLGQCFVEREIPASDKIGEHTLDEGLETGDLVNSFHTTYDFGEDLYYLFQASTDKYGNPHTRIVNGIACPLYMFTEPVGTTDLEQIVNYYHGTNAYSTDPPNTNNPDNMISINLIPKFLADQVGTSSAISQDVYHFAREMELDNYVPRNKKLFCYPYSRICVSNNSGTVTEYRWELFSDPQDPIVEFDIIGTTMGNPSILCYPEDYDRVDEKYDNAIAMTNFPPIPWINDTYKAFIAQNKANIVSSIIGTVMGTAGAAGATVSTGFKSSKEAGGAASSIGGTLGVIGSMASPVQNVLSIMTEQKAHQFAPDTVANLAQSDMIMLLAKRMRFDFYNVTLKREVARSIDEFFDAFGYACRRIKVPDIHARQSWSYVKTAGCILKGSAPADAKADIIKMFDNGIRVWTSPLIIGDFTQPNTAS